MVLPEEKNLPECSLQNLQPDLHPTMPSLGQEVANPSRELALTITRVDQSRNKKITHVDQSRNNKNTANNNFDLYELESVNTPDNDNETRYSSNNYENNGLPEIVSSSRNVELNPHYEEMPYPQDMEHQNNSHMKEILELLLEDSSNGDMKNIYTARLPVSPTHSDGQVAFVKDLFQRAGNDRFNSDLIPSSSAIDTNPNENIGSPEIVSFSINEELNPHDEEMPYSEDMEHQNNSHMKDILEPSLEDFSNGDMKNIYIAPSPVSPTHSDEEITAYVNDLAQNGGNDLFDSDLIPSPTTIVSTLDIFNTNPNDRSQNNQSMYADQNIKQNQYVPEYPNNELDHHDITLNKEIREDNNVSSIQHEQDQTPINNLEVDHDDYNMRNQYQQLKAPNEWYNENEINQNKTSILCIPDSVDLPTFNDQIEIIVDEAPDCIVPQKKPISMGVQSQTSAQKIVIVTKRESINPQAYQNDAQASWNIEHSGSNDCASSLSDLTSNPETGTCSADMVEPLASTSGEIERSRRSRQSLEGMSYKEKHLRMREQNNKASQKCRKKKKMEVEELFQSVGPLERRNQELRALLRKLELEKKKLLDHLKRTR